MVSQTGPKLTRIIRSISSAGMRAASAAGDAGVVDQDVPEALLGGEHHLLARIALAHVGWVGHRVPACGDHLVEAVLATGDGDHGGAPAGSSSEQVAAPIPDEAPVTMAARRRCACGRYCPAPMTNRRRVGALLAAGLLVIGCSGGGDGDDGGDTAAGRGGRRNWGGVPSPGCETGTAATPGPTDETIESQGTERRTYRQFLPSGYDGETPTALVLNIHGLGSNGDQQASFTGMEDLAEDEGFIAIHPNGEGELPLWNYVSDNRASNDIGFISELVGAFGERLCIDTHVYATGMSNGGLMSSTLVCAAPDQIAAASAVAGPSFLDGCEDGPPVPLK